MPPGLGNRLSEQERLLLQAALIEGQAAVQAWEKWLETLDFEKDPLPGGCFRLLPLVYRNLRGAQPEPPQIGRLRGIYNQAWYRSQVGLQPVLQALRLLLENKLQFCLLDDLSLAINSLQELAGMPDGEFNFYLAQADFEEACSLLQAGGWQAHYLSFPLHSGNRQFTREGAVGLRLTWKPFPLASASAASKRMQASRPRRVDGLELFAAPALDCLLYAATQWGYGEPQRRLDWLRRIGLMLKNGRFDPAELEALAGRLRLSRALFAALEELNLPAGDTPAGPGWRWRVSLPERAVEWTIAHLQPKVRKMRHALRRANKPE